MSIEPTHSAGRPGDRTARPGPPRQTPYVLIFLFLLLAGAISGVAWRFHSSQKAALEREVRNQLLSIADMRVKQLGEWHAEQYGHARMILANRLLLEGLRRYVRGPRRESDRAAIVAWMESLGRERHFAGVNLTDTAANVVLSSGVKFGDRNHLAGLALATVRDGGIKLTDFHSESSGAIHLGLNFALRMPGDPAPFGSLLLGIDPADYLYPALRTWPVPSATAETLLARRDGNDALFLNTVRHRAAPALSLRIPLTRTDEPAVRAVLGIEGAFEGVDYRGVPVYSATRRVPGSDWFLVAKIDSGEVLAPLVRRSEVLGALALSLIVAAGILVMLLWRRQQLGFYRAQYLAEMRRQALLGHYDYLTRFANDIILLIDAEDRIIEVNDRAAAAYGYTREELLQMRMVELRAPGERESYRRQIVELRDRDSLVVESAHQRRDGTVFPVEASIRKIETGGRVFRQSIVRDISERKRAEAELASSMLLFRGTFEQAAVGMNHVALDGRFLRVNQRWCELSGYSEEEAASLTWTDLTHPDDRQDNSALTEQLLRGDVSTASMQKRYLRKDGSLVWVWLTISVLRSPEGEPLHFIGVVEDITERQRVQEALRESEERFRVLVENAPDGIAVIEKSRFRYLNPAAARLFGVESASELVGARAEDRVHPDDRAMVQQRNEQVELGRPAGRLERTYIRTDGSQFPAEASAVPIEWDQRPAALLFFHDISERHRTQAERARLEQQLLQAQKMESIGRLAGGVSHDFNNLLTVINGYCDMLLQRTRPGDPARDELEEIRAAGERAAALTQQLLAFSRKQTAEPKPTDINGVVEEDFKMLRRLIGEDTRIEMRLDPSIGLVLVDRGQMHQVLMNLTVNARDAMTGGGAITISTCGACVAEDEAPPQGELEPGRYVVLSVQDTGIGMDEATLSKIFDPFFTTKPSGTGTGLGLSTVYGIARQSGGCVRVTSQPGAGALFSVYLPVVESEAESAAPAALDAAPALETGTVLVVEDQEDVRRLAAEVLRRSGYHVLEASTGAEALEIVRSYGGRLDLLLTDVVMPGMSGQELARQLAPLRPELPVLLMSGYTEDSSAWDDAREAGYLWIAKPFTPAELRGKVRQARTARQNPADTALPPA
jgi:two-component system, cell cycle sensor histidine kinase and response regulator CckA